MTNYHTIDGLLMWDVEDDEANGDVTIAHVKLSDGGQPPQYDLVLQQTLANILVKHGGAPTPVRIIVQEMNQL